MDNRFPVLGIGAVLTFSMAILAFSNPILAVIGLITIPSITFLLLLKIPKSDIQIPKIELRKTQSEDPTPIVQFAPLPKPIEEYFFPKDSSPESGSSGEATISLTSDSKPQETGSSGKMRGSHTSDIKIRRGNIDDTEWILHHRIGLFASTESSDKFVKETEELTRDFLEKGWEDKFHYYLIELDDEVIGGCGLTIYQIAPFPPQVTGKMAYLWNIFIEPEHRQKGFGRKLVHHIIQVCRELEIGFIGLHATEMAQGLYESEGFNVFKHFLQLLPLKNDDPES